jgi:hypothetical protein
MSTAPGLRTVQTLRRLAYALVLVPLVLGLAACSGSAPAQPTAKPAAASSSSSSAPKTTASPGASPAAKPSPSPGAMAGLQILDATLADATPFVSLRLTGGEPQIVSGWRLEVGDQSVTIPGNAIVQPDETLTLHAGEGRSSDREVFLGAESTALALAAKPGTRVRLLDEGGAVKAETTVPRF